MSQTTDKVQTVHNIVVFFDICSSTKILEDLLLTGNQRRWRNLLIHLKKFLCAERRGMPFEIYKFLGDGWVLLFEPETTDGGTLIELLGNISRQYARFYRNRIRVVLGNSTIKPGITFGIDTGELVRITMNGQVEYIGRPLNVAARLQAAIKQKDNEPEGKLLISNTAYVKLRLAGIDKYRGKSVTRKLHNISGGESYQAKKIDVRK